MQADYDPEFADLLDKVYKKGKESGLRMGGFSPVFVANCISEEKDPSSVCLALGRAGIGGVGVESLTDEQKMDIIRMYDMGIGDGRLHLDGQHPNGYLAGALLRLGKKIGPEAYTHP